MADRSRALYAPPSGAPQYAQPSQEYQNYGYSEHNDYGHQASMPVPERAQQYYGTNGDMSQPQHTPMKSDHLNLQSHDQPIYGSAGSAPNMTAPVNEQNHNYYGHAPAQNGNGYGYSAYPHDANIPNQAQVIQQETVPRKWGLTQKAWKRLYWMVPLLIVGLVLIILFEVYKQSFIRWLQPLTNWLDARRTWSWVLPVVVLFILSFPPLFGHELVLIITGLVFGLGIAIGIACVGTILGEAGCFFAFKYAFTGYVDRKRARLIKWEALARVLSRSSFKNVMLIRYSIVPPHLANPLFATTGMSFWIYMASVILSLPKNIVFVALGNGTTNSDSKGVKVAKVIAVGILCLVTLYATLVLRKQQTLAKAEVRAERGLLNPDGSVIKEGQPPRYPMQKVPNATYGPNTNAM